MSDYSRAFEDSFNLLCGEPLGRGIHRQVFVCTLDAALVVKVELQEGERSFANVREWHNWQELRDYEPAARWLAPCMQLSPDGRVLLQRRAVPLKTEDLPGKLPRFLTDRKWENFGWLDGRVVCVDYATIITKVATKPRKVQW